MFCTVGFLVVKGSVPLTTNSLELSDDRHIHYLIKNITLSLKQLLGPGLVGQTVPFVSSKLTQLRRLISHV